MRISDQERYNRCMRVLAVVLMLGVLVAACRFEPSGQAPDDRVDAMPGGDGREPDDDDQPWWDPAFQARVRITIDEPPTDETLLAVPVLVVLDQTRVDYVRMADDGRDLRFIDEEGNELEYEIERWDPAGRSFLWVRVPVIKSGVSTPLWLYYDNPDAEAPVTPSVWSEDYLGVWHLAEDAVAGQSGTVHRDASGNSNHGTQNGNGLAGASGLGAIGGAQAFDGDDDYIEIREGGLQHRGSELTLLARVYIDGEPNALSVALGSDNGDSLQWQISWERDTNTWIGSIATEATSATSSATAPAEEYTWYLLAVVYNGTEARLYVDGEPLGTAVVVTGNVKPLAGPLYIGDNPEDSNTELDGIVDEVRIAKVARSPGWLRVQHASMNDDLLDFGPVQCVGGC